MPGKRTAIWLVVALGAVVLWVFAPGAPVQGSGVAERTPPPLAAQTGRHDLQALPEREGLGKLHGNIFSAPTAAPDRKQHAAPIATPAIAQPAPPAPPRTPYRVAGRVVDGQGTHVVLAKGDAVLAVRRGDIVDGDYRVDAIGPAGVTLVYVPLGTSETLALEAKLPMGAALASGSPEPQPAKALERVVPATLRWEGPVRVRAGDSFTVALKITSSQPVRASPLQLSFDAKVLEPVGARAGAFYADGIFSYRVNPAGSIFIGAAGKGAVPSDAELVFLTFKPIRPGATAELRLSSLVLHGAGGAIAHDRPAVFRASVVQ
jgi:hypothetical protein